MPQTLVSDNFYSLRNQMLNDLILVLAIAATPSLIMSLLRIPVLGFQTFMAVQIGLLSLIWFAWFLKRQLHYLLRTGILLLSLWIATFAALSQMGPASDSKVFMIIFAFTSMLFLKARVAWLLVVGIILCMAFFGYAAVKHWLTFELDYSVYAYHPAAWAITTWNIGILSSIIAYLGWKMIHGLRQQSATSHELLERLKKISDRIPGVVYQFKLSADGESSFPYTSEGIKKIYGVTPESVLDSAGPIFSAVHPDDRQQLMDSIALSAKDLTPWRHEYRTLFPDGTVRWLSGDSLPQREDDGSTLWHGFIMDITDRKNSDKIKDEFVATVSHELRTPLTSIRGSIKLINSGALEGRENDTRNMLKIAENNSERLLHLIDDLLNIEKLSKGDIVLAISNFSVAQFLQECIAENNSYAQQCSTSLKLIQCGDNEISADHSKLKQVMANLISNACKYSPTDRAVEISHVERDNFNEICVTDHGDGIPEAFQDKIFEKFTQADGSDSRAFGGTGLGLSIVQKLVELHRGNVTFISKKSQGTTFIIHLPN